MEKFFKCFRYRNHFTKTHLKIYGSKNGPVTGYKFYIGNSDGVSIQGASNITYAAELSIRNDIQISVRVVAVNSAGESAPTVLVISLNGQ